MKKWGENNELADFAELSDSIKEAILFAYEIKRKNKDKSIPWEGYDVGQSINFPSPDETFDFANLKWAEEEHGRDALDEIITLAIQLGIEQGRRQMLGSTTFSLIKDHQSMADIFLKKAVEGMERINHEKITH